MPLNVNTLASGLDSPLRDTQHEAAQDFSEAYKVWFSETTGLLVGPAVDTALDTAKNAMVLQLLFTTDPTGGALLAAGITSFWAVIATNAAVLFTGATTAVPPVGIVNIPASLLALGLINNLSLTNTQAASAFAGVLHTNSAGGSWTTGAGPVPIV